MRIGIPREAAVGQPVVAGSPFNVAALIKLGYEVCVERGAGVFASFSDELYEKMGAQIVGTDEAWAADIVLCFDSPNDNHVALMKDGATLIARLNPWADKELPERYAKRGITALAMDAVPRISRAQSLDVRSSMMNVAGYRAVIEAANEFGRTFTGQVTAAGKTTRPRSTSSASAWRALRPSARQAPWAQRCTPPTCAPKWPTRWNRSAARSSRFP